MRFVPLLLVCATLAPVASALCAPTCDVGSVDKLAFTPPATALTSGSRVVWSSPDIPHIAATDDACLYVAYSRTAAGATFTVVGGALWAADDNGRVRRCTAATALPDGSFLLPYHCPLHSAMQANLVVK